MTPGDFGDIDEHDDQSPERDEHYEYETHLADDDYYGDLRYGGLMRPTDSRTITQEG